MIDWQVVLVPERHGRRFGQGSGSDYYPVELKGVYEPGYPKPEAAENIPRVLPADVKIKNHRSETSNEAQGDEADLAAAARGVEACTRPDAHGGVNSDGTMAFFEGPANPACVMVEGSPMLRVKVSFPGTSAIEIVDGSGFPCNVD